jgi:hypothetical protein
MPRVYTQIPLADRFWAKVNKTDGCWLWTAARQSKGYGVIGISPGYGKGYVERAHRVSWELHYGPIPTGMWVLHKCDVPACVRPDHLFLGTQTENMADAAAKGRVVGIATSHPERIRRGERHHWAKLTNAQIADLRQLRAEGWKQQALADRFGISDGAVSLILSGKRRANL